jgi:hypothetical protein
MWFNKEVAPKTARQKASEAISGFENAQKLLLEANTELVEEQAKTTAEIERLELQKVQTQELIGKNARIADKIGEIIA